MLGKLLKHDLKWIYKTLIVFYILTLLFAILTRGITEFGKNSIMFQIVGNIFSSITYALIINILINVFTRTIARFTKNMYGDESYLTHTLPVARKTVYLSKFLATIISLFFSMIIIVISFFIMLYSKENMAWLTSTLEMTANYYDSNVLNLLLSISVIFFLEMMSVLTIIFSAMIIGHRADNKRAMKSILCGLLFFFLTQGICVLGIFLIGLGNSEIMSLFTSNTVSSMAIKQVMLAGIVIYGIFVAIYYWIGRKQLLKGVNVQ